MSKEVDGGLYGCREKDLPHCKGRLTRLFEERPIRSERLGYHSIFNFV